jgi:hypothetical protein
VHSILQCITLIVQLSSWFYLNKLIINSEKSNAISFHAWQNKCNLKPEIVYQNLDIKYKSETKFLGLHLTEDIRWDAHITHVCNMLKQELLHNPIT